MPKIRDFRADFRRGRTGGALQVRQDATSYQSSVRDANNMMVLADGRIAKRWGTYVAHDMHNNDYTKRIVPWEHPTNGTNYMIAYQTAGNSDASINVFVQDEYGNLELVYDLLGYNTDLTDGTWHPANSTSWLGHVNNIDYLNFVKVEDKLLVVDNTIRPLWIQGSGTNTTSTPIVEVLEHKYFELDSNEDGTKKAPFYNFEETLTLTPNIFTIEGLSTGFNDKLNTLSQFTNGEYDLAAGTGKVTASSCIFCPT